MTKEQAIMWIHNIQNGSGLNRDKHDLLLNNRGTIAVRHWNDGEFTLGMEYGVMYALIDVFELKETDFETDSDD